MKTVFFPGSFDPFTKGHADIVDRMLRLADKVIIGIGYNSAKPESTESAMLRKGFIDRYYENRGINGRVETICYEGLTMRAAERIGADCVVRGVRNATDFDYEYSLACANREVFGIETLLLPADPSLSYLSSSVVRDLQKYDTALAKKFLP